MSRGRYIIVTAWQDADVRIAREDGDFVACADGGYDRARQAGLAVDAVIGDMDSIQAAPEGVQVIRHPTEKDDTDTLLCAKDGLARGYERFTIVGGIGGDFAHTVANLQVLSFLTDMECDAAIETGREAVFMVDGETVRVGRPGLPDPADQGAETHERSFTGAPGRPFSVFSYAERTSRVTIEGDAKYPLTDAVLTQSYPLGLHNEFTGPPDAPGPVATVRVACGFGRLLVVAAHPVIY